MAERKGYFINISIILLLLAYCAGFGIALFSIGSSHVLFRFALVWELVSGIINMSAWIPAILLVASALAFETSEERNGFTSSAAAILIPALVLSALVSVFYLLLLPHFETKKSLYEGASQLFNDSLRQANTAMSHGNLAEAERLLKICQGIDLREERYIQLNNEVKSALIRASLAEIEQAHLSTEQSFDSAWDSANALYLEALQAQSEGRLFDAHYLARKSLGYYERRPEVRRLVEETWQQLQRLGLTMEEVGQRHFYERKLEGYSYFQEGDFLNAYRIYHELSQDNSGDMDVKEYFELSLQGLSGVAFFLEEDQRAFSHSDRYDFTMQLLLPDGSVSRIQAERAAVSDDAVYFRNISYTLTDVNTYSYAIELTAPYARLYGNVLLLRAVDRENPAIAWTPNYRSITGLEKSDPGFALVLPFEQGEASRVFFLTGKVEDISLIMLSTAFHDVMRFGLDPVPLLVELSRRVSIPFLILILILFGAALGIRFKPLEPPGTIAIYLSAPFLVAFSIPPLRVLEYLQIAFARICTLFIPPSLFLTGWLILMTVLVILMLFISARIARRS
jgi:hypothetical protein